MLKESDNIDQDRMELPDWEVRCEVCVGESLGVSVGRREDANEGRYDGAEVENIDTYSAKLMGGE